MWFLARGRKNTPTEGQLDIFDALKDIEIDNRELTPGEDRPNENDERRPGVRAEVLSDEVQQDLEPGDLYFRSLLQELQKADLDLIEAMPPPEPKSEDALTIIGQHWANVNRAAEMAREEIVLEKFPPEVNETGQPLES